MVYNYNGVKVYYELVGEGKSRPIVLLHGWGRDNSDFDKFVSLLKDKTFLKIDFPPFGKSEKTLVGWNIYTYVGMLMSLCDHLNITDADFIGHSFGGRIVIILSAVKRSLVHSCILVDSAGMKPKRSLKYRAKLLKYKICRKFGRVTQEGSEDYRVLSPEMKETFKSVVNTYLEPYARKMSIKTLIIWGSSDDATPVYMAKRLNRLIKNSKLVMLENGGHFSFLDCPLEFFASVKEFYEEV